jgi:hypothetical protein
MCWYTCRVCVAFLPVRRLCVRVSDLSAEIFVFLFLSLHGLQLPRVHIMIGFFTCVWSDVDMGLIG